MTAVKRKKVDNDLRQRLLTSGDRIFTASTVFVLSELANTGTLSLGKMVALAIGLAVGSVCFFAAYRLFKQ